MANGSETTVPKFGSFKPRKPSGSSNPPNDKTKSKGKEREVRLGNHRIEKPKKNRKSRGDSYRARADSDTRSTSEERADRHRDWAANRDNHVTGAQLRGGWLSRQEHEPFFVDTRGDSDNVLYGKSNKWTVSTYYLYGNGSIVGLDPNIKIDRKLSNQSSYTLMYPRHRQPARVVDLLELDEPLEGAGMDEQAKDHEDTGAEGGNLQTGEMDFVPLPFRENQNAGVSMPVVTPKV